MVLLWYATQLQSENQRFWKDITEALSKQGAQQTQGCNVLATAHYNIVPVALVVSLFLLLWHIYLQTQCKRRSLLGNVGLPVYQSISIQ